MVPGGSLRAKQILALGWRDRSETLLIGTATSSETCCSAAQTRLASGRGGAHTIISGLAGATEGRLVPFAGRMLAAVATERGVWVAQSDTRGRFGRTHKLTGAGVTVGAIDAVAAPQNDTVTAWADTGNGDSSATNAIAVARGSAKSVPGSSRLIISLPAGHSIDELALAPAPARCGGRDGDLGRELERRRGQFSLGRDGR